MYYLRAAALCAMLGFSFAAAGCSGGGGGATPPTTPLDQSAAASAQSVPTVGTPDTSTTTTTDATITAPVTDATTATTVSSTVPRHVLTAALIWGYAGAPLTTPLTSIAPYVSWTQTSETYAPALQAAGLKVYLYSNFWRNYTSDNPVIGYTDLRPGGAHAPAEAKTCSGSVIKDPTYGGGYEADARSAYTAGHAQFYVGYLTRTHPHYNAVFSDDTGALGGIPYPCNWSLSTYINASNAVHASLHVPVFVNTIGAWVSGTTPVEQVGYTNTTNVIGAMCESCYAYYDNNKIDHPEIGGSWYAKENAEILMVARHKIFWDYARAIGYPQNEIPLRQFIITSFLLTYDWNYAMMQTAFRTNHGVTVMPETGLVPMSPLTTATSVSGYQRSGGAYMREYGACYYRGVNKGRCAVIVNPTTATVRVPTTSYGHSMGLVGSGVADGGYVTFTNARPTYVGSSTGVVLFP